MNPHDTVTQTGTSTAAPALPAHGDRLALPQAARAAALGLFPSVVTSLIGPFLTVYLVNERHYSIGEAASLVGATTLLNALLGLVSGHLVDRFDRISAARAGLLLILALPLALLSWPVPALLFAAMLLYGFGCALFDHSASATIYADCSEKVAKEAYSYYYAAHNCGTLLSPLAVYWLGTNGYTGTFSVALLIHLAVLVWYFTRFSGVRAATSRPRSAFTLRGRLAFPLPLLFGFGFCYSLTYSQFFSTLPVALGDLRLLDRPIYPLLVAINGLLVVLFQQLYVPVARRHDTQRCLLIGALALLASYGLLAASAGRVEGVLLFAVLFTLAEVFINLSVTDIVLRRAPEGQKTSWLSIYQASRLSGGLGIAAGGAVLAQHGAAALHAAFIATVLPMLVIATVLLLHSRRQPR